MKEWTVKDFTKAAIAVGFGLTFGKVLGKYAEGAINGVIISIFKEFASNGNCIAQDFCKKSGIKYEHDNKTDVKMEMGFHCK